MKLKMENFNCAMVVNGDHKTGKIMRQDAKFGNALATKFRQLVNYKFHVVLYTAERSNRPFKLLQFTPYETGNAWYWNEPSASEPVMCQPGCPERFLNAYCIKFDEILLMTTKKAIIFDRHLKESSVTSFDSIDPKMVRISSLNQGEIGYILSAELHKDKVKEIETKGYEQKHHVPGCFSWLLRCRLNLDTYEWTRETGKDKELLLIDEKVYTSIEYSREKMLVSIALTNLLIVHNWKPVHLIMKNSASNIYKNYFCKLPNFDE